MVSTFFHNYKMLGRLTSLLAISIFFIALSALVRVNAQEVAKDPENKTELIKSESIKNKPIKNKLEQAGNRPPRHHRDYLFERFSRKYWHSGKARGFHAGHHAGLPPAPPPVPLLDDRPDDRPDYRDDRGDRENNYSGERTGRRPDGPRGHPPDGHAKGRPGRPAHKRMVMKSYVYRDFNRIVVSGVYDIEIQNGQDYNIQLSGRPSAMRSADIRVDNDTLFLGHANGRASGEKRQRGKKLIHAYVSVPDLHEIRVSGVVEGNVRDVNTADFALNVSGVGDLKVTGRCERLRATLSGVGDLNARSLVCKTAKVDVSGIGDTSIHATQSLDAHVTGIGDLDCFGSPKRVRKNKSFFSAIRVHK